jgi:hypothetical protein
MSGNIPLTLAAIFAVLFIIFDIGIHITEWLTKSIIPASLAFALIVPIFAGLGTLIFFY